jgi:hypothetical protein
MRPLRVLGRMALLFPLRASTIFFLAVLATSSAPVLSAESTPFNGPRDYVVGAYPISCCRRFQRRWTSRHRYRESAIE